MIEFATKICKRFHAYMRLGPAQGRIASVFNRAVNIETPYGLVTLLSSEYDLHPFSCVLGAMRSFTQLPIKEGAPVLLEDETIVIPSAELTIDVSAASDLDLSVDALTNLFLPLDMSLRLRHLHRVVEQYGEADGLSPLIVEELRKNPYCELIAPRLPRLDQAFVEGDPEEAGAAASELAGCGVGLTPSSDDLLSGYFLAYAALSQALGRSRERILALTRAAAAGAAAHTTELSASFLLKSGEGLAAESAFALLRALFSDASYPTLAAEATKVAAFGQTSGTDILVGMYLAITKHYGGNDLD